MKNLIVFISHKYNKKIIERYMRLYTDIKDKDDIDIVFMIPYNTRKTKNGHHIHFFEYDNNLVFSLVYNEFNCNLIDPSFVIEKTYIDNKEFFQQYDYIYIYEYDVYYPGKISDLIYKLNEDNSDLIASYIRILKDNDSWQPFKNFIDYRKKNYTDFIFLVKSCLSFCRLSIKAFDYICTHYDHFRSNILYEMTWPTILINHGFTLCDLYKISIFSKFDLVTEETFAYLRNFKTEEEMLEINKKYNNDMLFTCYK